MKVGRDEKINVRYDDKDRERESHDRKWKMGDKTVDAIKEEGDELQKSHEEAE